MSAAPDWGGAEQPVLIVDPFGTVTSINESVVELLPDVALGSRLAEVAPAWLADPYRRLSLSRPSSRGDGAGRPARGRVGERSLAAYPVRLDDGSVLWLLVDETDRRRAQEALATGQRRFACLAETSEELSRSLNLDRCMEVSARLAAKHLADVAAVIVPTADRRLSAVVAGPTGAAVRGELGVDAASVPNLDEALRGYPPVPARPVEPSAIPGVLVPHDLDGPVGSAVVAPLPGHGMPAGALVLLRTDPPAPGSTDDLLLRLFATRAGSALSSARLLAEQVSITTALMRDLLPPEVHEMNGVDFAAGYRASSDRDRVSGDFYDVHPGSGPGDAPFVVLGDVAGKGLDAAVLGGKIRNTLQALLTMADDHRHILGLLNDVLLRSRHTQFATLVLATASRAGERVRLTLTCAGHPAPLIVRVDGRVEAVDTHGTLLGVLPTIETMSAEVELAPGETCLLFTDGLTDVRGGPLGGESFGEERLRGALASCAGLSAGTIVERVQVLASDWVGGGYHDDMAIVAITAPPAGSERSEPSTGTDEDDRS